MADALHEQRLRDGAFIWNAYRRANRRTRPDLNGADLCGLDLREVDLSGADLRGAQLRGANLSRSDLSAAWLQGVDLTEAKLEQALLGEADLSGAVVRGASFRRAQLLAARLVDVDVKSADFTGADIREAVFRDELDIDGVSAPQLSLGARRRVLVRCVVPEAPVEVSSPIWHALWDVMETAGFSAPADFSRPRQRLSAIFDSNDTAGDQSLEAVCQELAKAFTKNDRATPATSRRDPQALVLAVQGASSFALWIEDFLAVKWSVLGDAHLRAGSITPELRSELEADPELLQDVARLMRRFARQRSAKPLESEASAEA